MTGGTAFAAACLVGLAALLASGRRLPAPGHGRHGQRGGVSQRRGRRQRPGAEPGAVAVARAASEVAALLRAGAPAAAAWAPQRLAADDGDPTPLARALDAAARAAAVGGDPARALRTGHRPADAAPALDALALAWRTSEVTGAPAAAVLDRLVAALLDDAAAQDARDAALAGPRATARLLGVLPLVGTGLAAALGADPVGALLGTPVGRWCAAAGAACSLAGWAWTAALVRSAERAR